MGVHRFVPSAVRQVLKLVGTRRGCVASDVRVHAGTAQSLLGTLTVMRRLSATLALLALAWVVACEGAREPAAPASGPTVKSQWLAVFQQGTPGDSSAPLAFLPPVGPEGRKALRFDPSLARHVVVQVCREDGRACQVLPLVESRPAGDAVEPGAQPLPVDTSLDSYQADWRLPEASAEPGRQRVRVLLAGTELAALDVQLIQRDGIERPPLGSADTILPVGPDRVLPIRFRIDGDAVDVVGPAGKTINAQRGAVILGIPAGAVEHDLGIAVRRPPATLADPGLVPGTVFRIAPDSIVLAAPAQLKVRYDLGGVPAGVAPPSLRLHRLADDWWAEVFDSQVALQGNVATGTVERLGTYGVLTGRPVKQIDLFPDSARLSVGDRLQFVAVARDARGEPLNRVVDWSTTSPAVDMSSSVRGLVRALLPGIASITGRTESAQRDARVEVVPSPYPNQPVGFTRVAELPFFLLPWDGWHAANHPNFRLANDEMAPHSPPEVGEAVFPVGFPGGYEPMWLESPEFGALNLGKLYVSFWLWVSPNWQGGKNGINKIGFVWMRGSAVAAFALMGAGRAPLTTQLRLQDLPVVVARNLGANLRPVEVLRGQWHRWELLLISNTPGKADGEAHWWIHGVKVGEYKDITYSDPTQSRAWQLVSWRPVWAGTGWNDTVRDTMFMRMDHLYVGGSP